VPRQCRAKLGWVAERWSAAPTALGIIIHRCPSPSGLGSRLADGPPGLDELLARTFHSSELNRHRHVVVTGKAKQERSNLDKSDSRPSLSGLVPVTSTKHGLPLRHRCAFKRNGHHRNQSGMGRDTLLESFRPIEDRGHFLQVLETSRDTLHRRHDGGAIRDILLHDHPS
jgi:hypothetical protein